MTFDLIVLGSSLGGLRALQTVLSALPPDFAASVIVVQHREKGADETLAELLQRACALPVSEPEDKQPILPGRVYLAPPDYHLLVDAESRRQVAGGRKQNADGSLPTAYCPLPTAHCLLPTTYCLLLAAHCLLLTLPCPPTRR